MVCGDNRGTTSINIEDKGNNDGTWIDMIMTTQPTGKNKKGQEGKYE